MNTTKQPKTPDAAAPDAGMLLCHPRKPHRCRLCNEGIAIGEPCYRWSGFYDDAPFTCHAHPECYALTAGWDEFDWESCTPGDIKRPARPEPACPTCGVPWIDHLGLVGTCAENKRLRDIIRRASTKFCEDGSDAAKAAAMFVILAES